MWSVAFVLGAVPALSLAIALDDGRDLAGLETKNDFLE